MAEKKTPEDWAKIVAQVHSTGKMANTFAKALAKRYAYRWQFVDFRGPGGQESAGVVDIVAIRKSGTRPDIEGLSSLDLFDITLIQVKGGSAGMPTPNDLNRLKLVKDHYHAHAIVLFEWNKKKRITRFSRLNDHDEWSETTAVKLFGKPGKIAKKSAVSTTVMDRPPNSRQDSSMASVNAVAAIDPITQKVAASKESSFAKRQTSSATPVTSRSDAAIKAWVTRKAVKSAPAKS